MQIPVQRNVSNPLPIRIDPEGLTLFSVYVCLCKTPDRMRHKLLLSWCKLEIKCINGFCDNPVFDSVLTKKVPKAALVVAFWTF